MLQIIDGKRYNTETATCLGEWDNGLSYSDFGHCEESLHQTPKGAFFLSGSGGARSNYGDGSGGGSGITVIDRDSALQWAETHDVAPDIIAKHFEIEDA